MKNAKFKFLAFLMAVIGITVNACEPDAFVVTTVVDEPLQVYFERFIDEAAIRGLDVAYATSQVDATIGEITEPNVIGQCSWSVNHQHSITLDRQYWGSANDLQREFVVFHELGHCVLGLEHMDDADANGNCLSIMTSGTGNCRVLYNHNNRDRMLDDLFSE